MSADTLPGLLVERSGTNPNAVALRFFRYGKWNDVTYADLHSKAAAIGSGLASKGVSRGNVVVIIAEDGPFCIAAELGAQGIGASVLALDAGLAADEIRQRIRDSQAVCALVGDQEQFDKVDEGRDQLPSLKMLIVDATRGIRGLDVANRPDRETTLTVVQLEAGADASQWDLHVKSVGADDAARFGSRSATHSGVLGEALRLIDTFAITRKDVICVLHSISNPIEHGLMVAGPLLTGSVLHFRGRASSQQALRQVQPTLVHATPEWLERISAETEASTARTSGIKRLALSKGLVRKAASSTMLSGRRSVSPVRLFGIGATLAVLLFFLVTSSANDVMRLLVAVLIVGVVAAVMISSGFGVVGPLRRRYGLARCRAVIAERTDLRGADLLGALNVPLIQVGPEVLS